MLTWIPRTHVIKNELCLHWSFSVEEVEAVSQTGPAVKGLCFSKETKEVQ